jgi:RNA polymerase sigma factor (sigma-70 family)
VDRSEAEALAADLLADLALPPPRAGARTLLGTYDGSGSLFAWLSVILARRRASVAARRPVALPEEPAGSVCAQAGAPEPLDALLDGEATQEFGSAFARAWAGLNERERLLLLLKHRHGVKQADIAALLGIGAPRVSRVLDRAVAKIRKALHRLSTRSEQFGGGRPLWEGLRDVVVRHLARMDSLAAPPTAAKQDRKGTP